MREDEVLSLYIECFVARLPEQFDPSRVVDAYEELVGAMYPEDWSFQPDEAVKKLAALPDWKKRELYWVFPWIARSLFPPRLAEAATQKFWERQRRTRQQTAEARKQKQQRFHVTS